METSGSHPIESSIKGSDYLYDLVCKPCHLDDITKPAFGYCIDCKEHLCSMCYVNHKKLRPSRHHKLLDSSDMPQTQTLDDTDTTVDEGQSDSLTTPCEKHSEENIKFYCNDHKVTLCSVCFSMNHTKPCKVDYIPDISNSVLNSDTLQEIMARAESIEIKCDSLTNGVSKDTKQTIESLNISLSNLKKYKSDIDRILVTKEQEITKKITDLTEENNIKEESTGTKCQAMKIDAKLKKDTLDKMNTSKQPNQLFIKLQQTTETLDNYEISLRSIAFEQRRRFCKYRFIPNTEMQNVLATENPLGTISPQRPFMTDFMMKMFKPH